MTFIVLHACNSNSTDPLLPLLEQAQDGARLGSAGAPYQIVQHHESGELTVSDDGGYECYRHAAGNTVVRDDPV